MSEADWVGLEDFATVADMRAFDALRNGGGDPDAQFIPFAGLSHAEVLALEFPPERMLVDDLIPIGAVGTIAGVPETYKSWMAQRLAVMVASGEGEMFGKSVEHSGPVGYFWQDDSTREEAERVKLFHEVAGTSDEIPLRWFLNEGLVLPVNIERLLATITENGFVLVVLDSFYNILFGKDLKSDEAERAIAELKSKVCDITGCTVVIVDHMPWATETNRGRLRSYGGVFKGAATRFGIYIDAVGKKLWVEARGNNIVGFKRTLAEWDAEELDMKLLDSREHVDEEDYEQRIVDYLTEHPWARTDEVDAIKGTKSQLVAARGRLLRAGRLVRERGRTSYKGFAWNLSIHAGLASSQESLEIEGSNWFDSETNQLGENALNPSTDAGSTSSIDETNQLERPNWFGGSTSSPLRGDTSDELVDPLPNEADDEPDDSAAAF